MCLFDGLFLSLFCSSVVRLSIVGRSFSIVGRSFFLSFFRSSVVRHSTVSSFVGIALFSFLLFAYLLAGFGSLRFLRSGEGGPWSPFTGVSLAGLLRASGPPPTSHSAEVTRVVGCFHSVRCGFLHRTC